MIVAFKLFVRDDLLDKVVVGNALVQLRSAATTVANSQETRIVIEAKDLRIEEILCKETIVDNKIELYLLYSRGTDYIVLQHLENAIIRIRLQQTLVNPSSGEVAERLSYISLADKKLGRPTCGSAIGAGKIGDLRSKRQNRTIPCEL